MAGSMNEISQQMTELPLAGLIPVLALLAAGAALWAFGSRILRPGLALLAAAAGGAAGWAVAEAAQVGVPPWAVAAAGAMILGVVAWAGYRLTLAAALAGVGAILAPLLVWTAAEAGLFRIEESVVIPPELTAASPREEGSLFFHDGSAGSEKPQAAAGGDAPSDDPARGLGDDVAPFVRKALGMDTQPGDAAALLDAGSKVVLDEKVREHVEQARGFAQELLAAGDRAWQQTPEGLRPTLIGAAIVGAILGLVLGGLMSRTAAALLTTTAGSLMALAALWALTARMGFAEASWRPGGSGGPGTWAAWWLIIAAAGLVIQFMTRTRTADKAA
jgi:hypothetical protein